MCRRRDPDLTARIIKSIADLVRSDKKVDTAVKLTAKAFGKSARTVWRYWSNNNGSRWQ